MWISQIIVFRGLKDSNQNEIFKMLIDDQNQSQYNGITFWQSNLSRWSNEYNSRLKCWECCGSCTSWRLKRSPSCIGVGSPVAGQDMMLGFSSLRSGLKLQNDFCRRWSTVFLMEFLGLKAPFDSACSAGQNRHYCKHTRKFGFTVWHTLVSQ
jgi:hypothetical protein